jgi:hypothetical protein
VYVQAVEARVAAAEKRKMEREQTAKSPRKEGAKEQVCDATTIQHNTNVILHNTTFTIQQYNNIS